MTLLVGLGARHARAEVLELADRLAAPMVLTLKAKEGFDDDNPYEIGQSGLIGNPATAQAFDGCDVLVLVGTDFPYRNFLPRTGRPWCSSTSAGRTSVVVRRSTTRSSATPG